MIVYLFVVIQIYSSSAVFFYLIVKLSLEKSDEPFFSILKIFDGRFLVKLQDKHKECRYEDITTFERTRQKKFPAISKDYKETPLVGVDGFEPPTLCL